MGITVIDAVVIVAGWIAGWLLLGRPAMLTRSSGSPSPEELAVVVPARDEADRVPELIASLVRQSPSVAELVVVDDGSRDGTAEAASRAGATVLVGVDPPSGWTGKSWACHQGAEATTSPLVAFVDADVTLSPEALAAAQALHHAHGGLVSVQPRHDIRSAVEALSMVFNMVAAMALGLTAATRRRAGWGAAGPLLVTSRAELRRAGGHAAVAGAVAEDLALAARYRAAGLPVTTVLGGDLVRFRMYRDGQSLWRGWHKNLATGARSTPPALALGTALWVTGVLGAGVQAVAVAADRPALAVALYGAVAAQMAVLGRRVGRFGPAAALWPVLMVAFLSVLAASVFSTFVLRRVRWSGRTIPL